jgi:hypothetical protein
MPHKVNEPVLVGPDCQCPGSKGMSCGVRLAIPDRFNEFYYKCVVARAIIFRRTEKLV